MKVIVAHPGKQHSYRLASALKKSGDLLCYCTTVYDKDHSILMKFAKKILSSDNLKRANNRKNKDLCDEDVIQIGELGGLLEALLFRIDKTKSHFFYEKLRNINADIFGIKVAKIAIKSKADAVIMYDSNAMKGFRYLKKKAPYIKRILDVSIAARPYLKSIYSEEIARSGNRDLYLENKTWWGKRQIKKLQNEIDYSDYFLAASSFVQESLEFCGAKKEQILKVPYGANVQNETGHQVNIFRPLEILYVGQVTYRKGITYLLEAIDELSDREVHLTIVGAYNPSAWYVKKYSTNEKIEFKGLVTLDKMTKIYSEADVFVIDSIAEGMAQVGIEAMTCGVPIICSHNSGIDDIVEDGVNGYIIPCCNVDALRRKIIFLLEHREILEALGENGKEIASRYTWEEYERNVVSILGTIF